MIGFLIALAGKEYWAGDNLAIVLLLLGALMPDIDSKNSIIGKKVRPLSNILAHRGMTHSLAGMLVFVAILQVILYITGIKTSVSAFMAGYASHLIADSITPKGVEVLYPLKFKIRGSVHTNSIAEKIIFTILLAIGVKMVYF